MAKEPGGVLKGIRDVGGVGFGGRASSFPGCYNTCGRWEGKECNQESRGSRDHRSQDPQLGRRGGLPVPFSR